MEQNKSFFRKCVDFEVKPSEKYRKPFTYFMFFYALIAVGNGSVNWFNRPEELGKQIAGIDSPILSFLLSPQVLIPIIILAMLLRYVTTLNGYLLHKKQYGEDMPMEYSAYQMGNIVLMTSWVLVIFIPAGILALFFGWDFNDARSWYNSLGLSISSLLEHFDEIPTLYNFPPFVAFISASLTGGFIGYWWHRLCHTWRPLWLLLHRPHHTPKRITEMTSLVVDDAGFGFFLKKIILPIFYAVVAKLFTHDSTSIIEILVIWTYMNIVFGLSLGAIGHTITYYQWANNNKIVKLGFFIIAGGPFHLVHHSAHKNHQVANVGFCPLYVWDILFGTFVNPGKETPETGLTNSPDVYMNPFRLVFSGWAQMYMEFKHNKSWKDRFMVVFGPNSYVPPKRYLYHLRSQ